MPATEISSHTNTWQSGKPQGVWGGLLLACTAIGEVLAAHTNWRTCWCTGGAEQQGTCHQISWPDARACQLGFAAPSLGPVHACSALAFSSLLCLKIELLQSPRAVKTHPCRILVHWAAAMAHVHGLYKLPKALASKVELAGAWLLGTVEQKARSDM
jgi:hypothetical protein